MDSAAPVGVLSKHEYCVNIQCMTTLTKTLKVRVRDKHAQSLRRQAAAVNYVWNYVNELSSRSIRERGLFLSGFDLQKYTNGAG